MEQTSDAELAGRAARGDDSAFAELVRRYQHAVYEMSCRMLRDRDLGLDAAQEVFLKAHGALDRYDGARKFSTWILAIARNHCIDQIRKPSNRPNAPLLEESRMSEDPAPGPGKALESAQARKLIEKAVEELPEIYREAIQLYHFQELSYAESAEVQGVPQGTFMARLHRARKQLGERLRPVLGAGDAKPSKRRNHQSGRRRAV